MSFDFGALERCSRLENHKRDLPEAEHGILLFLNTRSQRLRMLLTPSWAESEFTPPAAGTALQTQHFLLGTFPCPAPFLHLSAVLFSTGCKTHPCFPFLSLLPFPGGAPPPKNRNALVQIRRPLRKASRQRKKHTPHSLSFFLSLQAWNKREAGTGRGVENWALSAGLKK